MDRCNRKKGGWRVTFIEKSRISREYDLKGVELNRVPRHRGRMTKRKKNSNEC